MLFCTLLLQSLFAVLVLSVPRSDDSLAERMTARGHSGVLGDAAKGENQMASANRITIVDLVMEPSTLTWDVSLEQTSSSALIGFKDSLAHTCLGPWGNILTELQSLASQDRNKIAEDAIESWLTFGAFIGLTEEDAEGGLHFQQDDLMNRIKSGYGWSKMLGCCLYGCACTSYLVQHPLRVCKGCFTSMYCSKKCQKK